jgi:hypothetical protein
MAAIVNGVPVAIPPPDGYVVDFDNPQRNGVPAAYWMFGIGNFLMLLSVLQRVYVRIRIHKTVKIEDGIVPHPSRPLSLAPVNLERIKADEMLACLGIAYVCDFDDGFRNYLENLSTACSILTLLGLLSCPANSHYP